MSGLLIRCDKKRAIVCTNYYANSGRSKETGREAIKILLLHLTTHINSTFKQYMYIHVAQKSDVHCTCNADEKKMF